ncbi:MULTISPECIES: urease accessory protein UreD [unclassified Roseitalea]|uniref:urease accessory protein UreD n=1 Tax=unclassified Roseitalea TaxID=2639107 RepID=UPI00273FD6C6|nr:MULTISPECIES: urease accessory protein UreD [unclassified Roseitalea]
MTAAATIAARARLRADAHPASPRMQRSVGAGRIAVKAGADGRTRLAALYQKANAKIRVPRQHHGRLEAVLINTAGGLTGGDRLNWDVAAGAGTHAVITTQACERIYRAAGGVARQRTAITVDDGARIDWLPQETIVFDRAALARTIAVDLAPSATFTGIETLVFGRKAMRETVHEAFVHDRWRIARAGRLVHGDDVRIDGAIAPLRSAPGLFAGCDAMASIVHCARLDEEQWAALAQDLRARLDPLLAERPGAQGGVSAFAGKCVVRLIAADSYALRPLTRAALDALRGATPLPAVWHS